MRVSKDTINRNKKNNYYESVNSEESHKNQLSHSRGTTSISFLRPFLLIYFCGISTSSFTSCSIRTLGSIKIAEGYTKIAGSVILVSKEAKGGNADNDAAK